MTAPDALPAPTLGALLEAAAGVGPDDAMRYLGDDGEVTQSYAELVDEARRVLAGLRAAGAARGEPVLLLYDSIRRFLPGFWACQLGGLVAAPLGLAPGGDQGEEARRLVAVWRKLGGPRVVTEGAFAAPLAAVLAAAGSPPRVLAHEELAAAPAAAGGPAATPDDLALVQFSSGSTGAPKGVLLTNANLLANVRQMAARARIGRHTVELSWLPHFHDMGLIGCHLAHVLVAARQVKMAPRHFLRRPLDWLGLATRHRATLLTGTNTSLRLLLRKLDRAGDATWDLAAVEAVFVGAEPVSPAVVRAVQRALAPYGLGPHALRQAYGLAEACVGVAMGEAGRPPRWQRLLREPLGRREVVAAGEAADEAVVEVMEVGPPLDGCDVRIADDDDRPLPERAVGHVLVRGPNITAGYWDDAAAAAAARCGDFWRTGDLGFLDHGRLVVCGRTKELLFVGGRNLHAPDVEAVATEVPGVRAAVVCAAVGAGGDAGAERTLLFLVPEASDWRAAVPALRAARRRVQQVLRLPVDHAIPIAYRDIPRTSSGKVRRFRLAERFAAGEFAAVSAELEARGRADATVGPAAAPTPTPAPPPPPALQLVISAWAGALGLPPDAVGPDVPFGELSGSSVVAQDILARLEEATGRWLGYELLLDCETPAEMARWLDAGRGARAGRGAATAAARTAGLEPADREPADRAIAVIGLACRLPGAPDPERLFAALRAGHDAIRPLPGDRWRGQAHDDLRCRTGSFLDDPYAFDPAFFDIPVDEARVMDPQGRLVLAVACECLQRAGYGGGRRAGARVGVFVGASQLAYQERLVAPWDRADLLRALCATPAFARLDGAAQAELRAAMADLAPSRPTHPNTMVGNLLNMLACRVAHELDLQGPALAVDTACSSALVAVHLACESLRRGECELAVAAGVSLNLTPTGYRLFEAAGALSPTGRSRPFARDADGFVPGEGAGAVVLRPLAAARRAGDVILAVIRGAAVNNDGRSLSAMAPNPDGQLAVLRAAYADAGVDPATVGAVECHGTGTAIGDPVELRSVIAHFGATGAPLHVGSIKSNYGHLLAAAGIAGLLKTVLALRHRTLLPTLHADPPLPHFERPGRLRLVRAAEPWTGTAPLRAGVSSFGFGGTNCHVVLEEAPAAAPVAAADAGPRLVALSAPSLDHLRADAQRLLDAGVLEAGDVGCAELLAGRPHLGVRAARVLPAAAPAAPALRALAAAAATTNDGWRRSGSRRRPPQVAWLFPGQGAQHHQQALGLYRGWPAFRERFEALCALVPLEPPLAERCYGEAADDEALRRTDVAQPLLVAFQIALGQSLLDLGLRPAAVIGHSVGELAAACVAGALDPPLAVRLAAHRGRLMEELGGAGAMLAVHASEAEIHAALGELPRAVAVAALNGPRQTVLAGAQAALAALEAPLARARIHVIRVPVRHGFHSPLMAEAATALARADLAWTPGPFAVPLVSTVSGARLEGRDFTLDYLATQIREPVRFAAAFGALAALGVEAFLDVGPGATLAGLARHLLPAGDPRPALALCRPPGAAEEAADWEQALRTLGELWVAGAPLAALPARVAGPRPRVALPALPFRDEHCALEEPLAAAGAAAPTLLHVRAWRPLPTAAARAVRGTWLVIGDGDGVEAVRAAVGAAGARAVTVRRGATFVREAEDRVRLDPRSREHARQLLELFAADAPAGLVLLPALEPAPGLDDLAATPAVEALPALAHAARLARRPWPLWAVTGGACGDGAAPPDPVQAAIAAMVQALGHEVEELRGRVVDVATATPDAVARALVAELGLADGEPLVARRDGARLAPRLEAAAPPAAPLPPGGAWLVVGGTGGVGGELCRWLANPAGGGAQTVVIAGRRPATAVRGLVDELARHGVRAEPVSLDVTDAAAVTRLVTDLIARHGRLRGVVHCAGVVEVGAFEHRVPDRLRAVLDPKIRGARHLATALAGRPVDHVALISSVAGAVPALGRGLVDYAGANAFLDAFAAGQRAAGATWTAVAYSRWRGVGMAADLESLPTGPVRGPLERAAAAAAFGAALGLPAGHVVVADPADVARWSGAASTPPRAPATPPAPATPRAPAPPAPAVAAIPPDAPLEEFLRLRLAQVIGIAPGELDPDAPFQRLGLTSLAAVDLLKELEVRLGRPLGVTLLFEHNTLAKVLAFLGDASPPAPPAPAPAPAPPPPAEVPLLPAQQTFYANQAFFPHLPGYVFLRVDLRGAVRPASLDAALAALARRHPMLGVGFAWSGGALRQRPTGALHRVSLRDLGHLAPAAQEEALLRWEAEIRNEVYDLRTGPLLRVGLARTGPERAALLFNIHHIVADAWSAQLLVTELLTLHAELVAGRPAELPPLRSSFSDCVRAIGALHESAGAESLAYWARTLADPPPPLALPYDGDPRAEVTGTCQLLQRVLDAPATQALARSARSWDVSFFHVLFASYLVGLRRWSGQRDVIVRVANARREARVPDIERVVGSFADSLPIRVRVDDHAPLPTLCAAVRQAVVEAQRYPFASSLQLAGVAGDRDHLGPRGATPAGLSFPNFPAPERFGDLEVAGMRAGSASGFTQLGLIAWTFGGRLHLSWNTIDGLFRPATVERLAADHLEIARLLGGGDAVPGDLTVADALAALDHAARGRVTAAAPAPVTAASPAPPPVPLPPGATVHERVLGRAATCPDAPAVVDADGALSYGDLARRVATLATALAEDGAGAGARVGLLCRPGAGAAVGALGILASGAAYVPIDPEYPDARAGRIAAHSAFPTLVTTADQLPRLAALATGALKTVVLLDEPGALARPLVPAGLRLVTPADQPAATAPPAGRAGPDDLAYVIYTSGTTGTPKGAMVQHRSLTLFLDWVHEAFGVTAADRFMQTAPLSFGSALRQVFSPLLAGGCSVAPPRGLTRDPQALARFVEQHGITIWNSVPTLWMLLLDAIEQLEAQGEPIRLERVRWVLIGGEDLPARHVRRWWDRFGPRHRVVNLYGGAETITNVLYHEVRRRPADHEIRIPIGRPAAGAEVLILDDGGRVITDDAVGEIAIGGPKLALGYLDDPERTAAAFVPHPAGRGRVYRTGDLGRREPAGDIVFLGRTDSQVKIHGHRVELSEIENTLNLHPAVRAAAVVLHDDGHLRLLAFMEPARPGGECDSRELRAHLERLLPAHMVPHRFTWLEALPRNPIGKIERSALLRVAASPVAASAPPASATQALVAQVWREVLGVTAVRPEDDFFELGGDSMLALEVLQRLRGRVAVLPRPLTLYGERTLARLAAALDALAAGAAPGALPAANAAAPPAVAVTASDRLPLTPTQESFVLAQRLRPERSPIWCARLPLTGRIELEHLQGALRVVVERHALLRTVFETDADLRTWQRVLAPQGAPLAVDDVGTLAPAEQEQRLEAWFQAEQRHRFALDRWPLWRFRLVARAAARWELLVTMHHAIADGWSCHVLGAELLHAYRQLARGHAVTLPPLRSSFHDVVAAGQAPQPAEHAAARAYWSERFARPWPDARPPDAAPPDADGESPHEVLEEATTRALRRAAAGRRRSLHGLVLTAWARALRRAGAGADLVVGCALSGRDLPLPDADRLFGPLATALPLRVAPGGDDFAADLEAVDGAFAEACRHAGLPVDELLRQIPRHPGAPFPPGRQLFFTFMDFSALPPLGDGDLAVDLDRARFHFAAQATDTELMLGALAGTRLRLHVHGQAPLAARRAVLADVVRELAAIAATAPRGAAAAAGGGAADAASGLSVALDAAVVAYLPEPGRLAPLLPAALAGADVRALARRALFPAGAPILAEVQRTPLGRAGAILVPWFADELATAPEGALAAAAAAAVEVAERHGARCVSFAGLLPAATGYGLAIERALAERRAVASPAPARLTSGHAATAAAVVTNVVALLRATGTRLSELAVAVVGFGSIGQAALRLLLATQPAPRALHVCDLARERDHLRAPLADLAALYPREVRFAPWGDRPPAELHDCDLIIGAASAGGLLDPEALRPGTLLADDSFPPLCDEGAAVRRMEARGDVLLVGAGALAIRAAEIEVAPGVPGDGAAAALRAFALRGMPGCRAESLLLSHDPALPAVLGLVRPGEAMRYLEAITRLGIAAPLLHLGGYAVPASLVAAVRARRHDRR